MGPGCMVQHGNTLAQQTRSFCDEQHAVTSQVYHSNAQQLLRQHGQGRAVTLATRSKKRHLQYQHGHGKAVTMSTQTRKGS
jgi:hypothetical protein